MVNKIAIFGAGNLFNIGGLQRSYSILTDYLVGQNHQITFFAWDIDSASNKYTPPLNDKLAYPLDPRVDVILVKSGTSAKNFKILRNHLQAIKPDVVLIINSSQAGFFLMQVATSLNLPTVFSIRGSSEYCLRYLWPCRYPLDLTFKAATVGHVLMPSYKNIYPEVIQKKLTVIPSQIEPAKKYALTGQPNQNGRYVILYSGRISFEKRVPLLVKAFSNIAVNYINWDLWIYGDGPDIDKLKRIVHELDLSERVFFNNASNTDEMYQIYPECHIKALPSEQEGCPMALREAMAHRIPVIAYAECSGCNEIITDQIDGLLVDNIDRVSSLTSALVKLIINPDLRMAIGNAAEITAMNYSPLEINKRWEKLILSASELHAANSSLSSADVSDCALARAKLSQLSAVKRYSSIYSFNKDFALFLKYEKQYLLIYGSPLFDVTYYLENYLDVKISGEDPLLHYLSIGWLHGYDPSPWFSNDQYITVYMNSMRTINPLYHYYTSGIFCLYKPISVHTDYFDKRIRKTGNQKYDLKADLYRLI